MTCGKIKGQSSNFDTSSKVLENSCEDSKPGLGSLNCDLKTGKKNPFRILRKNYYCSSFEFKFESAYHSVDRYTIFI